MTALLSPENGLPNLSDNPFFLSVAVTTEYYKQCDDYYPDDVVIVEKIAQTVHSCSSVYNLPKSLGSLAVLSVGII